MLPVNNCSAPPATAGSHCTAGEKIDAPQSRLDAEQLVLLFPILQAEPFRVVHTGIVSRALQEQLGSRYAPTSIAGALRHVTHSARYFEAMTEGAPTHDLDGNVVGEVSAGRAAWAREKLASINSGRRPIRISPTLRVLCERFPELFNLREPKPLPPGTYKFLLQELAGECAPSDLGDAVRTYCHRIRHDHSQKPDVIAARCEMPASSPTPASESAPETKKRKLSFNDLKTRYSACFDASPPRPLAQSVPHALETELRSEFSRNSLKSILRKHIISRTYLSVLVAGAPRYNLSGEVDGVVTEAEAEHARSLKADPLYLADFMHRMREGKPLTPGGREQLLAALESSDLSVHEFTQRYKLPSDTIKAQRGFALQERSLERQVQKKIADEYASSGLSEHMFCTKSGIKLKTLRKAIDAAEVVEAERISAALNASIAAQKHAPLSLHTGRVPAMLKPQAQEPPTIAVRRRRRIVVLERPEHTSFTPARG